MQNWPSNLLAEQRLRHVLLDERQLRQVQFVSSNILIEAYAEGTLCTMNDNVLRRRAEVHLGWSPNTLDSAQARFVVSQVRHVILLRLNEAAASTVVRYTVLGVALESIRHYLHS
ncbi:hypothetical protein PC9H_008881 [Pleurotus ostreatus]|uniref:Uncharacterized protein n=2 Tax=Pleurotus TaxID=5320 RepID=A0A8H7DQZ5_PLEOS|nr:uncharacterized protein PC9H_008881 [Pleurotus ostreatus]KAF7426512.1 hypothetical protein PC9H_008881 [Pleurotus ostreatus]KAG9221996.1 hypothetical protein CCMSSC00406_0009204 [Pleurotus cornucopiae]